MSNKIRRVLLGQGRIHKINLGEASLGVGLYRPDKKFFDLVKMENVPYGQVVRLIAEILPTNTKKDEI